MMDFKFPFLPKQFFIFLTLSIGLLLIDLLGGWRFLYRWTQPFFQELQLRSRTKLFPAKSIDLGKKQQLANQIDQCQVELVQLKEENDRLRKLLNSSGSLKLEFEVAKILAERGGKVRLSGGRDKNFKINLPVVWEGGFLGKITKVNEFDSEAQFVNNSDFRLAVGIWKDENSLGKENMITAKGVLKGGKQLVIEDVLKDESVEKDFFVVPLGFPGRFLVGKVSAVSSVVDEFKKVVVEWNAKGQIFDTVFVIKNLNLGE